MTIFQKMSPRQKWAQSSLDSQIKSQPSEIYLGNYTTALTDYATEPYFIHTQGHMGAKKKKNEPFLEWKKYQKSTYRVFMFFHRRRFPWLHCDKAADLSWTAFLMVGYLKGRWRTWRLGTQAIRSADSTTSRTTTTSCTTTTSRTMTTSCTTTTSRTTSLSRFHWWCYDAILKPVFQQ